MSDFAVKAAIGVVDRVTNVMRKIDHAFNKTGDSAEKGFKKAEKAESHFMEMFKAQFAAMSAEHLVERAFEGLKRIPEAIDGFVSKGNEIAHTSQIIGMTAENYQKLVWAAHMQDISQQDVVTSMQKLNNNMGQLRVGTGALFTTVARLNPKLATQLMQTKDSTQAMLLLSDALKHTTNSQNRAAIAQAAFGRSGQVMLPLLLEGRAGVQKLMDSAGKYGDVLSQKVINQTLKADDSLKKIKGTMANLKDQVLGSLLTKLNPLIERFQKWVTANKALIATKIDHFIKGAVNIIREAIPIVHGIVRVVGWFLTHRWAIIGVWEAWTVAQIALNVAMDANPIGLITLGIEALIGVVILVITYWHQITGAVKGAWTWFNRIYDKSVLLRNALFFLASPIWLVVNAIRALVDLIEGKGLGKALENLIPPWAKGLFGLGKAAVNVGESGSPDMEMSAPNAHMGGVTLHNHINVDNSRAPGTNSNVRVAPPITGYQGQAFAGGM